MTPTTRHSKQRDAVYDLLRGVTCHPSAEWLYTELKKEYPKISLATVYRNLGLLVSQGKAISIDVGDGIIHYDAQAFDHNHFYCRTCGELSDIGSDEGSELDRLLENNFGVEIDSHSFVFYGKCKKCVEESNKSESNQ